MALSSKRKNCQSHEEGKVWKQHHVHLTRFCYHSEQWWYCLHKTKRDKKFCFQKGDLWAHATEGLVQVQSMMLRAKFYVINVSVAWKSEEPKIEPWEWKYHMSAHSAEHEALVLQRSRTPHKPRWQWMVPPCLGSGRLCSTVSKDKRVVLCTTLNHKTTELCTALEMGEQCGMSETTALIQTYMHTCMYSSNSKVDAQRQIWETQKQFRLLFHMLMRNVLVAINLNQEDQLKVEGNSCSW